MSSPIIRKDFGYFGPSRPAEAGKKYFYRYLEPCGDPGEPDDPEGMGKSGGGTADETAGDGVIGEGMDGEGGGGGGQQYCLRSKTVTRRYYVSGGKVLMEKDMETGQLTKYIYAGPHSGGFAEANDERITMIDYSVLRRIRRGEQGRVYYYVKDHLGSTRVMVRDDGVTSAKYYRYTAYGDCKKETMSIAQPNKFISLVDPPRRAGSHPGEFAEANKPLDGELGLNLYYFGARYYMPNLGRWTTVDPLVGKYPGWSPYVYALDNPVKFVDPNGKWVDEANAQKFIEMAKVDLGKPYGRGEGQVDCSQLVDNALYRLDKGGIKTALYENKGGSPTAATILTSAENGETENNGLQLFDYDHERVQTGDLLVTSGHVEIVTGVTENGVNTVGASFGKKQVLERKDIDPTQTGKKKSPWGNDVPKIVKINEENKDKSELVAGNQ